MIEVVAVEGLIGSPWSRVSVRISGRDISTATCIHETTRTIYAMPIAPVSERISRILATNFESCLACWGVWGP